MGDEAGSSARTVTSVGRFLRRSVRATSIGTNCATPGAMRWTLARARRGENISPRFVRYAPLAAGLAADGFGTRLERRLERLAVLLDDRGEYWLAALGADLAA